MSRQYAHPFHRQILDEIALEGLQGVTLPSLWVYLSKSFRVDFTQSLEMKAKVWSFVLSQSDHLQFYELPEERVTVKDYDRFAVTDPILGVPIEPDECPLVRYKLELIEDGEIRGSCEHYHTRKNIDVDQLFNKSVAEVLDIWGTKFVIVASQDLRLQAITSPSASTLEELSIIQYCVWEAIGRARLNGEITTGKWSLLDFCKDATTVFYIKNTLRSFGFITAAPLTVRTNQKYAPTILCRLERFHVPQESVFMTVVQRLLLSLKARPDYTMPFTELHTLFPKIERPNKTLKAIFTTPWFQQLFEISKSNVVTPTGKMSRPFLIVRLRDPDAELEDIVLTEKDEEDLEGEDAPGDFQTDDHAMTDMPLKDEFLRAIHRFGPRGASHAELSTYLSCDMNTVRQMLKRPHKDRFIVSYCVDSGKQKITRYVAYEFAESIMKKNEDSKKKLKSLKCTKEPSLPPVTDSSLSDIEKITSHIKPLRYDHMSTTRKPLTSRTLARKEMILNAINKQCFINITELRGLIARTERDIGHKDLVCAKSVYRILASLIASETVQSYEVTLKCEERVRVTKLVTHPKIDIDHPLLRAEVIKMKNNFFVATEERRLKNIALIKAAALKQAKATKKSKEKFAKIRMLTQHRPPKLLTSRFLHEFLFYVTYELTAATACQPITEQLLKGWQQAEPSLDTREYLQEIGSEQLNIDVYSTDISWKAFIPPLPAYENKPLGWVYFPDAFERMPLSLYNKLVRVETYVDNKRLLSYLNHPVKQHYLVKHLPCELRHQINIIRLHSVYQNTLKLLNNMGLLQVAERAITGSKDPQALWVYLNRRTNLMDTTTTEPSSSKINANRTYSTTSFEFSNEASVNQYWVTLHEYCVFTKLGFRKGPVVSEPIGRNELGFLDPVDFAEAPQRDTGDVPGDRSGAGGISSRLFSHQMRHWSWVVQTKTKQMHRKIMRDCIKTKKTMQLKTTQQKVIQRPQGRRIRTRHVAVKRTSAPSDTTRRKSKSVYDAIDHDALQNMRTLRVIWRKEEDVILKIARTVYIYISASVLNLGLLTVGKVCRDILRHSNNVRNKTTQSCVRRFQFLAKRKMQPEVPTWLHLLEVDEHINRMYGESFLHRLKLVYPNRTDYCDALIRHFVLIMGQLCKLIREPGAGLETEFLIPDTVDDFERELRVRDVAVEDDGNVKYLNPSSDVEVHFNVIKSVLHSSLCCTRDKTHYNLQVFEIFKNYSEDMLHNAFNQARDEALIVPVKRKSIQHLPNKFNGATYLLSSRYMAKLKFQKIPYGIYALVHQSSETALEKLFGASTSTATDTGLELKSPNAGQFVFLSEGLLRGYWQVEIKLPSSILTVDAERSNMSHMDRIIDHYHNIFEHAPQTEYVKVLESNAYDKQVHIKFHPANLSYKVYYSPFDVISKLSPRYLHFFCALGHLDKEVDINFYKLHTQVDDGDLVTLKCPFQCILEEADYMEAIERLVRAHQASLKALSELPPQKLLLLADTGSAVKVEITNLLTLVKMIESFWRENELKTDLKDFGKVSPAVKSNKNIDWLQLCRDILNYDSNDDDLDNADEYEPTLNKEQRLMRAQDVLVVNLPTVVLNASEKLQAESVRLQRSNLNVPSSLLKTELEREVVLKKVTKDSHWKYTEQTFESLLGTREISELSFIKRERLREIHDYIERHRFGVTAANLMHEFTDEDFLQFAMDALTKHNLVKRVGLASFAYVHKTHIRPWIVHTFHVKRLEHENLGSSETGLEKVKEEPNEEPKQSTSGRTISKPRQFDEENGSQTAKANNQREVICMRPKPWMRLNGSLNRRVLDRWMGSVLIECIASSGSLVQDICAHFPQMVPVDIMALLEFLSELKCVSLRQIKSATIDLFTSDENIQETVVTGLYDPAKTFVTANGDAITRLASFIGTKKYSSEFI